MRKDSLIHQFIREESGQGISEYGAVIAFVAILVSVVFAMTSGGFAASISSVYSSMATELNALNQASGASSSS